VFVLTAVAILVVIVMVIFGLLLFYSVFTASKEGTTAIVQNNDFQLQASVDKTDYRYGEPVTVNFKITYLGRSPVKVNMPAGCACVITVKNATESWIFQSGASIAFMSSYDFTPGQYITGSAVITGGDIQYRSSGGGGGADASMLSDKPFSGFSPGGSYYIQVKTNYLNASGPIFETELTTSSLQITIIPE
jgi:hypothetical protein